MRYPKVLAIVLIASAFAFVAAAQQPAPAPPQTPRQALIEMITGGEKGLRKHLTVEVQQAVKKAGNEQAAALLKGFGSESAVAIQALQIFETGPILLTFNEPAEHKKFEVHLENDDLSGEEDTLDLSFHSFTDGLEQSEPWQFMLSHFSVGMKRQQGIWRINKISVGSDLPVGDAAFLEKLFGKEGVASSGGMYGMNVGGAPARAETAEPPKLDPAAVVMMLTMAEGSYATNHPEIGFTCSLPDLLDAKEALVGYTMDPELAGGRGYGYKFAITGCEGKPAGSFQLSAEPLVITPGAKAFCTDATRNMRFSDDGRSGTCISSGKPQGPNEGENLVPEVHTDIKIRR